MPQPGQVVRRGQPAGPGAHHQHPPTAGRGRRVERPRPLQGEITQEPLDPVDRHGAVQIGPVAHALAGVVADPPVDGRQRVVPHQFAPRLLVPAGLHVRQPGLDVLPGRATGVARRQQIQVDRPVGADRTGTGPSVEQIGQRRDVLSRAADRGLVGHTASRRL